MNAAFLYLAIGAAIVGVLAGDDWSGNPGGYVVSVLFWPFISITVAASMVRDALVAALKDTQS